MTPICNDILTRVRSSHWRKSEPPVEQTFRVGDRGEHHGMTYTIKGFGTLAHRTWGLKELSPEHPRCVWLIVKYRGDRAHKWDTLCIGDTNSFREKLVLGGRHPNPVFTHYWPKDKMQPL